MPLPTIETPKYTVTIPSTKKTVEYRPYLVKEEKILMLALESSDEKQMLMAVKDIVRACTFEKINPDDLTTVDLEYVFLKLRAKSVGETTTVKVVCKTPGCSNANTPSIDLTVNLDSIEPRVMNPDQASSNRINLTDRVGMTLKPITVRAASRLNPMGASSKTEQVTMLVVACIESIFDDKGTYRAEDYSVEELTAFVDSLSTSHVQKINAYIESLPRLAHDVDYSCPKCKANHSITLQGLQSFFA